MLKFNTHKDFPRGKRACTGCGEPHYACYDCEAPSIAEGHNTALSTVGNLGRRLDIKKVLKVIEAWVEKYSDPYEEILYDGQRESIAIDIKNAFDKGELTEDV